MNVALTIALLDDLRALGVGFRVRGGALQLSAQPVVPQPLLDQIETLRADIIALIEHPELAFENEESPDIKVAVQPRSTPCYACAGLSFWTAGKRGEWVCAACHPPECAPADIEWLDLKPLRRGVGHERGHVGCDECRGSGFRWIVGGAWRACERCNSGWDSADAEQFGGAQ